MYVLIQMKSNDHDFDFNTKGQEVFTVEQWEEIKKATKIEMEDNLDEQGEYSIYFDQHLKCSFMGYKDWIDSITETQISNKQYEVIKKLGLECMKDFILIPEEVEDNLGIRYR